MKKILPLLLVLFSFVSQAQIVNIPDVAFKNALTGSTQPAIDANHDGEIQVSEAAAVHTLNLNNSTIYDLTGILAFTNLSELNCGWNHLSGLDVSGLPLQNLFCPQNNLTTLVVTGCNDLTSIFCGSNQLGTLNLTGLVNLRFLECSQNLLSTLDVSSNTALVELGCSMNQLGSLDLTTCTNLQQLYCDNNQLTALDLSHTQVSLLRCMSNQLTNLNVKNNLLFNYTSNYPYFDCAGNPNLQYVCADEGEILFLLNNFIANNILNAQVDANCSFSSGGGYSTNNVNVKIDIDNNGCSSSDSGKINLPVKLYNDADTSQTYYTKTDSSGMITLFSYAGNYSIVPSFESPYYTISPDTLYFSSTANTSQDLNFCISPNGTHNDLDITIAGGWVFAGNPSICQLSITYTNKGTTTLSGTVQLSYDESKQHFENSAVPASSQMTGIINWDFTDLLPFETRTINTVSFSLYPFPVNNVNDTLTYVGQVAPDTGTDETPADNVFINKTPLIFIIVPIGIEYFKGNGRDGKNDLEWKANCLSTNAFFEIERSVDSRKFTAIGNLQADQLRCQQPFDFIDNEPMPGINYYRLKMKDDAGKISYSNIIALLNKETGFEIISMSSNPVASDRGVLNITSARSQHVNISIIDIMGRALYATSKTIPAGLSQVELNFAKLPKGVYTIRANTKDGERRSLRFMKQ